MGKLQILLKLGLIFTLNILVHNVELVYGVYGGQSPKFNSAIVNKGCLSTVGNINENYVRDIKSDTTLLYVFPMDLMWTMRNPRVQNVRVEASVGREGTLDCPVIFVIGQQQYTTSMELPFTFSKNETSLYYQGGRTLCIQEAYRQDQRNITIRVSTCSKTKITYSLRVSVTQDYLVSLDQEINLGVSPYASVIRGYSFLSNDGVSSVKIRAISQDNICATISIQPFGCPVYDQETNVKYSGLWQTMTKKVAMTVEKSGRFKNGFDIVAVVHPTDVSCLRPHGDPEESMASAKAVGTQQRRKSIRIEISGDARISNGYLFLVLFIPVASSFILIFLATAMFRIRHKGIQKGARKMDVTDSFAMKQTGVRTSRLPYGSESENEHGEASPLSTIETDWSVNVPASNPDEDLEAPDAVVNESQLASAKSIVPPNQKLHHHYQKRTANKNINANPGKPTSVRESSGITIHAEIHIGDFTKNQGQIADKNARRFCWSLITVAVFYIIPVYQLIFSYLGVLYKTGEYDLCYYNYLCAYRVGYFLDFNHFFSNIGYVIFGFAFMWIVRRRDANIKFRCEVHDDGGGRDGYEMFMKSNLSRPVSTLQLQVQLEEEERQKKCQCFPRVHYKRGFGVPQHFGVFYSLGLALIMEGFLSAAYHICPNQKNFQFDTCFMYVISVLIILKIYQFRHPIALDAHQTFLILAILILVSVAGLMLEFQDAHSTLLYCFRISFTVFQFILIIVGSVYYYNVGYVKDEKSIILTDWKLFSRVSIRQPKKNSFHVDRLILPFLTLSLCIAVVIYAEMAKVDFATYLLYTFIANVLGNCFYYIVLMKPLHGEFKNGMWIQPTLYFLGCMIIGGFAVTYFVQSPAQWEKSASESRSENNVECMHSWFPFQPFYDVHDVWHFYSAAALFLAFMGLLTVDDDLVAMPQNRIPVF